MPRFPRAGPGWDAGSQPKGCGVSGWWKGRRCVRAGWARRMSSLSLAHPSVPNTPARPSGWGTAPFLGCSGSAGAGGGYGQRQGLCGAWSAGQGSPGWAGCSQTSPPAALDAAWKGGCARQRSLGSWLETCCRVKMHGPSWRTESSSRLLTRVMSFMVPQPAPR